MRRKAGDSVTISYQDYCEAVNRIIDMTNN